MIQIEKLAATIVFESMTKSDNTHIAIESRMIIFPKKSEGANVTHK